MMIISTSVGIDNRKYDTYGRRFDQVDHDYNQSVAFDQPTRGTVNIADEIT